MLLLNGDCARGLPYLHLIHRVKAIHDKIFLLFSDMRVIELSSPLIGRKLKDL